MAWQPRDQQLQQLTAVLKDTLSGHDQAAQKNATQVGEAYSKLESIYRRS